MNQAILPADLGFFSTLVAAGSLSAAARELGVSTPAVSKRLALMEARLALPLLVRTTRRMSLTPEGELLLEHARRILGDLDALERQLGAGRDTPSGMLRVNATLGFGRSHLAAFFVQREQLLHVFLGHALAGQAHRHGLELGQQFPQAEQLLQVHLGHGAAAPWHVADPALGLQLDQRFANRCF